MQEVPLAGPADAVPITGRIEMRSDTDIHFWCRVFDISPSQLRRAVQQVGPQVAAVRRHLEVHQPEHPQTGSRWVEDSGF